VYCEMLTGRLPFTGRDRALDLSALPDADRPAVARALRTDPADRFPTSTAFFDALPSARKIKVAPAPQGFECGSIEVAHERLLDQLLSSVLADACDGAPAAPAPVWLGGPGGDLILQYRFHASLPPGGEVVHFDASRRQWNGELAEGGPNSLAYRVGPPESFLRRWFAPSAGLRVEIHWTRPRPPSTALPEVVARVRSADRGDSS